MTGFISRGFKGLRRTPEELKDRLPPGQYYEPGFPVLTAGPTPDVPLSEWSMRVDGMVAETREWSWEEFGALPFEEVPCDIHCVTKWSKLGTSFRGVSVDVLLDAAEPLDAYAMAYSHGGYTTNHSIEDLTDGKAWVVTEHEGEPLPREHGGPARLLGSPPLLLEEREMDRRTTRDGSRRAGVLGGERLPQPRRSVA